MRHCHLFYENQNAVKGLEKAPLDNRGEVYVVVLRGSILHQAAV